MESFSYFVYQLGLQSQGFEFSISRLEYWKATVLQELSEEDQQKLSEVQEALKSALAQVRFSVETLKTTEVVQKETGEQ